MDEIKRPELENGEETPLPGEKGETCDPVMAKPFDPTKIQIQPKQDVLRNLIDRLRNDEIDMNTDFQRHAELWDSSKMSRLIESILIRFPLPAFYFDATNDNKWLIVDGLQRLSAIRKFVIEKDEKKRLHLVDLEYLGDKFKGEVYDKLPREYQRRIDECPITLFQIMPGTPDEVKYSVFRRINTGGLVLNSQEIRNALAKPQVREFLQNLADDENLRRTMGDQSKRMLDQELVLRFISFFTQDYEKSPKNIAEFMDECMESLKTRSESTLKELEKAFRRSMSLSFRIFGDDAFEKRTGEENERGKRKNTTLFEVWTVSLARTNEKQADQLIKKRKVVVEKLQALIKPDAAFYRAITYATQKREHVRIRYDAVLKIINEVAHD
jgi:hypothetical protein